MFELQPFLKRLKKTAFVASLLAPAALRRLLILTLEARKSEHDRLPTPSQRKKDNHNKSSYVHATTCWLPLQCILLFGSSATPEQDLSEAQSWVMSMAPCRSCFLHDPGYQPSFDLPQAWSPLPTWHVQAGPLQHCKLKAVVKLIVPL